MTVLVKNENSKKEGGNVKEMIPPEGGWGWMVVLGTIICGMITVPVIQNFGLIYKGRLNEIGITSTQLTTIISMNTGFGQLLGIFQGPLIKRFGYRKVAAFGVSTFTLGTFLTGFAQSFPAFLLTHGIITSIGFTYTLTPFSMAISSFFRKKRSRASGLSQGFTGIGPVVMPQLVTLSLYTFDVKYTAFLLAALTSHAFIGVCLLRPISWYLKEKVPENELCVEEPNKMEKIDSKTSFKTAEEDIPDAMLNVDAESYVSVGLPNGFDSARRYSLSSRRVRSISGSDSLNQESPTEERMLYNLPKKNTETSLHTLDEEEEPLRPHPKKVKCLNTHQISNASSQKSMAKIGYLKRFGNFLSDQFDLDLLKDPIYVNITLGLCIAVIGELIFSLLTPFILAEVGLDLQMIASFMSVCAIADIISRFVSPYLGEIIKCTSRQMYILALFFLLISRASLLFVTGTAGLMVVAILVGFAKGVRTVFWSQVLPDHVAYSKLPSAMSIQNLMNGILIFIGGPLSGVVVAINNSYLNIIYVSNALTALTILLWTSEFIVIWYKGKNQKTQMA